MIDDPDGVHHPPRFLQEIPKETRFGAVDLPAGINGTEPYVAVAWKRWATSRGRAAGSKQSA